MGRTVMIVDDDLIARRIAEKTLKQHYDTVTFSSGQEALDAMEAVRPDLCLIDLHMPRMNGHDLMERIRTLPDPGLSQVPIVMMTSDADMDNEIRGFDLGASDFIRKPLLSDVLTKRVDRVMLNEEERRALSVQAHYDSLTGLLNRSAATKLIDDFSEYEKERGVLLMMDVDKFKSVNDSFGHRVGDQALQTVAKTLRQFVRSGDVLGRIGGDEFIIFYRNFFAPDHIAVRCRDICETVRDALEDLIGPKLDPEVGISIGVARMPEDGRVFDTLYRKADQAMYRIKQNGRGSFCFFDHSVLKHDNIVSFSEMRHKVEGSREYKGAYEVRYEDFCSIVRFLQRNANRPENQIEAQMVLITVEEKSESAELPLEAAMQHFGHLLGRTIRLNDVIARYSDTQYMVLLIGTDEKNAHIAMDRVKRGWTPMEESRYSVNVEINSLVS